MITINAGEEKKFTHVARSELQAIGREREGAHETFVSF